MARVPELRLVEVRQFDGIGGSVLFIHASGDVPTSGWSNSRLSPRFYATPPLDGLWEFDFLSDPPAGLVLDVVLPTVAEGMFALPDWAFGVRVIAQNNSISAVEFEPARLARRQATDEAQPFKSGVARVCHEIASFDDSINPIDYLVGQGCLRTRKLRHTLTLTVQGPDEIRIRRSLADATGAGLVAAIVAVYANGGGALFAAVAALLSQLKASLDEAFLVRVEDQSRWV